MGSTDEGLVKIFVDLYDAPFETESFWAKPRGSDLYELRNSPWYACDLHFGDVVRAVPDRPGEKPRITEVVHRSGHKTLRVRFPAEVDESERLEMLQSLHPWRGLRLPEPLLLARSGGRQCGPSQAGTPPRRDMVRGKPLGHHPRTNGRAGISASLPACPRRRHVWQSAKPHGTEALHRVDGLTDASHAVGVDRPRGQRGPAVLSAVESVAAQESRLHIAEGACSSQVVGSPADRTSVFHAG